ncbi:hypothetical protein [Clostridium sp.]|uniref:hypothetical protein n=1 Tax=Clostridium sp. TaxID=1506 RepID=UPI003990A91E
MPKLINKTRFTRFANDLWDKIKRKYDVAFKEATISASDSADKKITLTRVSGTTVDVNLQDYARLQDRNEFKKDVSVDNVGVVNNSHIGTTTSVTSIRRGLGFRQLTTSAFVDGHVDHIKIYLGDSATGNATFKVWAITKGATNRDQDRVNAVAFSGDLSIETVQENGQAKKIVNIPINKSYATETYFIVRSTTNDLLVVDGISQKYRNDSVNLGDTNQPPDTPGSPINWDTNAEGANTAIMYLYGRESIGSLAEKLKQTQADGSLYVLKSETTAQGGQANAGKVAKLDQAGKLDANMLPAIAINEFISVSATAWDEGALNGKEYQNGDVIFHEATQKRYLCVDRTKDFNNGRFVELNSKDGVVSTVNDKTGAVVLNLESTENLLKLKIGNGSGTDVEKSVDIISDAEIEAIINGLN